jgi:sulfur relay (sulfurtransferase) complex TusBCD TusD component (DsrE family)
VLEKYLTLLLDEEPRPKLLGFVTEGVTLACEGSPVLGLLEQFAGRGVHLVVCKTCLEHFGLQDRMRVGVVGGMGDLVSAMTMAEKVITW